MSPCFLPAPFLSPALVPQCSSTSCSLPASPLTPLPVKAVQISQPNWVDGSYFARVKITERSVNEPRRRSVFDIIRGLGILVEGHVEREGGPSLFLRCVCRGWQSSPFCLFSYLSILSSFTIHALVCLLLSLLVMTVDCVMLTCVACLSVHLYGYFIW